MERRPKDKDISGWMDGWMEVRKYEWGEGDPVQKRIWRRSPPLRSFGYWEGAESACLLQVPQRLSLSLHFPLLFAVSLMSEDFTRSSSLDSSSNRKDRRKVVKRKSFTMKNNKIDFKIKVERAKKIRFFPDYILAFHRCIERVKARHEVASRVFIENLQFVAEICLFWLFIR